MTPDMKVSFAKMPPGVPKIEDIPQITAPPHVEHISD